LHSVGKVALAILGRHQRALAHQHLLANAEGDLGAARLVDVLSTQVAGMLEAVGNKPGPYAGMSIRVY
jgi:hypothetical protein